MSIEAATTVRSRPSGRRWTTADTGVAVTAFLVAAAAGTAVVVDLRVAALLAIGAVAVPLALVDLPLAVAAWVALGPITQLGSAGIGATGLGALVLVVWASLVCAGTIRLEFGVNRTTLLLAGAFVAWLALSAAWAPDTAELVTKLWPWVVVLVMLMVLLTTVRTARDVRLIAGAVIVGTVVSVIAGFAGGGLGSADVTSATATEGRLQGGAADPNFLAAFIVPAAALLPGVAAALPRRSSLARAMLVLAFAVLIAGLAASQSRGGVVAAVAAFAAALLIMRGRRVMVLLAMVAVGGLALSFFAVEPSALERITSATDRGNGREDLWVVAGRMASDHPLVGVGLGNFTVLAPDYVRRPGALAFVDLVADRPHETHNEYLQRLAENGIIGVALFAALAGSAVLAAVRAARRLQRIGEYSLAWMARCVVVADAGLLAAAIFLSVGPTPTLWVFLALGPVLLAMANGRRAPSPRPGSLRP
jgi:O-antigen ligase